MIILNFSLFCFIDYTGLIHKKLKEGRNQYKHSMILVFGAPGTGKSSIMKLLLNFPPPTLHHSTSLTTASVVRRVETPSLIAKSESTDSSFTNQFWEQINTPYVKHMIAKAIKIGVPSSPVDSTTQHEDSNSSSDDDSLQDETSPDLDEVTSVSPSKPTPPPVAQTVNEIVKIMPTVKESPELFNFHWIYCVDSGGQAAFMDIASAILRYSPINILTQKLNKKLEDKLKGKLFLTLSVNRLEVEREITNLQLLESSFRLLASIDQHNHKLQSVTREKEESQEIITTLQTKLHEYKQQLLKTKG